MNTDLVLLDTFLDDFGDVEVPTPFLTDEELSQALHTPSPLPQIPCNDATPFKTPHLHTMLHNTPASRPLPSSPTDAVGELLALLGHVTDINPAPTEPVTSVASTLSDANFSLVSELEVAEEEKRPSKARLGRVAKPHKRVTHSDLIRRLRHKTEKAVAIEVLSSKTLATTPDMSRQERNNKSNQKAMLRQRRYREALEDHLVHMEDLSRKVQRRLDFLRTHHGQNNAAGGVSSAELLRAQLREVTADLSH